jgi:hypothetical protein
MMTSPWQQIAHSTTGARWYVRLVEVNPRARTGYGWQTGRRAAPGQPIIPSNGARIFATRDVALRACFGS